jgi:hypothetical protein
MSWATVAAITCALLLGAAAEAGAPATAAPDERWRVRRIPSDEPESAPRRSTEARRRGPALVLGAGVKPAEAVVAGSVDLSRPGTLTLWVKARAWSPASPDYVPIARFTGLGGATLLVERDRRDGHPGVDRFIAGFFGLAKHGEVRLDRDVAPAWGEERHFLAVAWEATGFALRLDRGRSVRAANRGVVLSAEFPSASTTLRIGGAQREGLLVEDASIWSRVLTDDELDAVMQQ